MQSLSLFFHITKINDFRWEDVDAGRTQGICQVICIFFGSSLGTIKIVRERAKPSNILGKK